MMKTGLSDTCSRLELLEMLDDLLPKLQRSVHWEQFRPLLSQVHEKRRKSNAGRKPYDVVLMFKVLVLQHLYNLSDEQIEYQIRDRYSFCRFLDLSLEGHALDARTVWLFCGRLKEHECGEALFVSLMEQIRSAGYSERRSQFVDASVVSASRQRNSRCVNDAIKQGDTVGGWEDTPAAMRRQKDIEARWTKKNGENHYGYKNHVSIDNQRKLIRRYGVTTASVHDSQVFDELLDPRNTSADVWADSACRSRQQEKSTAGSGYRCGSHTKGTRTRSLSRRAQLANTVRSRARCRVEHEFGAQEAMGDMLVRIIGMA